MISYGIGILPRIRMLKSEFTLQNSNGVQMMDQLTDILQTSEHSLRDFSNLVPSPNCGYLPESSKSI